MSNDIVVLALASEAPELVEKYSNVHLIGVGKVNAAINLTKLIYRYHPKRVINVGTAGGITVGAGVHRINRVVQHDMNLIPLGLEPGKILNDPNSILDLGGDGLICATGDVFVTEPDKLRIKCDIIDMEAYSVARACNALGTTCEIWKYISDNADAESAVAWKTQVKSGQDYYKEVLQNLKVELVAK